MSWCVAGLAVALMALKIGTWLALARFSAPPALNAAYAAATLLMLWSYAMAVTVAPASAPPAEAISREEEEDTEPRYCERCDAPKAALAHHCSRCRRCVYRMDHHCPWTNNCVGWNNKKHFVLFLLYTALSCLLFHVIAGGASAGRTTDAAAALLLFTRVLSLLVGGVLAGYLLFHMWLLHRGLTTLEFLTRQRGELADTSLLYNVTVYFGTDVACWWLPVAPALDARLGGRTTRQLMV